MTNKIVDGRALHSNVKGQLATLPEPSSNACGLAVEDHEDTRLLLRARLELRGGISVVEADNEVMAIGLAESLLPDLVLMDSNLPLIDSYEATRRIHQLMSTSEIPIVFIYGHAQPAAEAKAFAAGCADYLVKPFALRELNRMLERQLSQGEAN